MIKPLERNEWNFSDCLDQERSACAHYEYAREFLARRHDLRERLSGKGRHQYMRRYWLSQSTNGEKGADGFPILSDNFPNKPWLSLPRVERKLLLTIRETKLRSDPESELLAPDKWELECLSNFAQMQKEKFAIWQDQVAQWFEMNRNLERMPRSLRKLLESCPFAALTPTHFYDYVGPVKYALIALDWRKSDRELIRAFSQLLQRRHEDPDYAPKLAKLSTKNIRTPFRVCGERGRPTYQLKHLGIMRLITHFGGSAKVVTFLDEQKTGSRYKNVRSVETAAGKARAALRKMEKDHRFWAYSKCE